MEPVERIEPSELARTFIAYHNALARKVMSGELYAGVQLAGAPVVSGDDLDALFDRCLELARQQCPEEKIEGEE